MILKRVELSVTAAPTTSGFAPKRRCQRLYPNSTTGWPPSLSSCGRKSLPRIGRTPRVRRKLDETRAAGSCSGSSELVRLKLSEQYPAISVNDWLSERNCSSRPNENDPRPTARLGLLPYRIIRR